MGVYKVRAKNLGAWGYFTQADHYEDFELDTAETLEELARRLASSGFAEPNGDRWIMPGAIVWIKQA